ncbi:MAG: hypothetical protein NXI32_26580 [bacterium]|nr:hypothetical protein [bacterium]
MNIRHICRLGALLSLVFVLGCESRNPNWKEVTPVTGVVMADGKPAEGVNVFFNPVEGIDTVQTTITKGMTDPEGKFSASTYELNDGAPEGEYKLTFKWQKLNPISMTFDGDKFNGRYADEKKSEYSVTVTSGPPLDLGVFELRTK